MKTSTNSTAFIKLGNLSKSYSEGGQQRPVLQEVSASFSQGESIAILGRSGSGKSTLLNLISGIDLADSGSVWVNGSEVTAFSERQRTLFRRHNIGVIFQFFNLIPTLTVWENVILPLELSGVKNSQLQERAEPLLEEVGLLNRRNTSVFLPTSENSFALLYRLMSWVTVKVP